MLGSDICDLFSDFELVKFTLGDFDITDLDTSISIIKSAAPDYLIHAAAYTDVDGSENEPDKAFLVNGIGARNIAMACEEVKCPVIYISSDYIFDGEKDAPYSEWDTPNPINRYGLSKLIGEKFISSLTNRYYIIRTSWLFGSNGKNFVETISRLIAQRDSIDVVDDQTGSPTYTRDLAEKIKELLGRGYGTYHVTNSSQCSWYEFAVEIAKQRSSSTIIKPTTSDKFRLPARRPPFSVLNNTMLRLEGLDELRPWQEALADYLSQ